MLLFSGMPKAFMEKPAMFLASLAFWGASALFR